MSTEDNSYLLSVGRLEAYKRVDRIIAALPHFPKDYTLALIGLGPQCVRLERLAECLNVRDRVQFLGRICDEELRDWYLRARIVVSLSEGESFGLVVRESLASGCQVVCNNIPAFRDFSVEFPHAVSPVPPICLVRNWQQCCVLRRPDPGTSMLICGGILGLESLPVF